MSVETGQDEVREALNYSGCSLSQKNMTSITRENDEIVKMPDTVVSEDTEIREPAINTS